MRRLAALLLALACPAVAAASLFDGGHIKARALATDYPGDSVFNDVVGGSALDTGASLRLKFAAGSGPFSLDAHYQLLAEQGDSLQLSAASAGSLFTPTALPDDQYRWWDLTHVIDESDDSVVEQRLDRLSVAWTSDKAVLRFGRQAVSWGNGLIYTPMDFLNPFDPAAVDTEYKTGDDMLYGQYLLDSGDDWQFVNVQRRDVDDRVSSDVSSTAIKFHGFSAEREFDLLLARHYDETVLGLGGLANVGEAVVRGDLVVTDTREDGWVASAVVDWTWSWVWGGRNVSAVAEYFYNGYGLRESQYADLIDAAVGARYAGDRVRSTLLQRLYRGELFTIGRHYLAGSLLVEVTPLLNATANVFCNLGDQSALGQLVLQWSAAQDWQLLAALNLPAGSSGTEYGGLETGVGDSTLAVGPSAFVQLAWYF